MKYSDGYSHIHKDAFQSQVLSEWVDKKRGRKSSDYVINAMMHMKRNLGISGEVSCSPPIEACHLGIHIHHIHSALLCQPTDFSDPVQWHVEGPLRL